MKQQQTHPVANRVLLTYFLDDDTDGVFLQDNTMQYIVWAVGDLDSSNLVLYHRTKLTGKRASQT